MWDGIFIQVLKETLLIVFDNASSHNYLYSVPYTPKHYLKQNKQVLPFNELEVEVKKEIKMVQTTNYFKFAYGSLSR